MGAKAVLFLAVSQVLEQCLARNRCLINVCGLNLPSPEGACSILLSRPCFLFLLSTPTASHSMGLSSFSMSPRLEQFLHERGNFFLYPQCFVVSMNGPEGAESGRQEPAMVS